MIESQLPVKDRVIGPKTSTVKPVKKSSYKKDNQSTVKTAPKPSTKVMKRPFQPMSGPSNKMVKLGVEAFQIGETVFARNPENRQPALGKVTCYQGQGKYGIVFLSDQETEYINMPVQSMRKTSRIIDFSEEDLVRAYFNKNNQWMKASISELDEQNEERCKIKFDNLDNEFDASFYHMLPEMCIGDPCFALWGRTGAYVPAVIEDNSDIRTYSIAFKGMEKKFAARPDNIIPVKSFDVDEKCLALWARDGKFYPATVREIVDEYSVKIQFGNLEKLFPVQTYQLRYFD